MKTAILLDTRTMAEYTVDSVSIHSANLLVFNDVKDILEEDIERLIIFDAFVSRIQNFSTVDLLRQYRGINIYLVTRTEYHVEQYKSIMSVTYITENIIDKLLIDYVINNDLELGNIYVDKDNIKPTESIWDSIRNEYQTIPIVTQLVDEIQQLEARLALKESELQKQKKEKEEYNLAMKLQMGEIINYKKQINSIKSQSNRINKQIQGYKHLLSKPTQYIIDKSEYERAPRILILKEYRNFKWTPQLVETLAISLLHQQNKTSKILWVHDKNNPNKIIEIPKSYHFFEDKLEKAEIHNTDYIAAIHYKIILEYLLENKAGNDILIIIDSRLINTQMIIDDNMITLNIIDEAQYIEPLSLLKTNTITNEDWNLDDVKATSSNLELFANLSSKSVISLIIRLISERWWNM